jgi:hypothetical protein
MEAYASEKLYGHYVGHDEPSNPFYSSIANSGNQARWQLKIPSEPPTQPTRSNGVTWNFMLHPAFWFGMAMCSDESFPEFNTALGACAPNSDSNIADNVNATATDFIGNHVGSAYMEFQFYPPGWAPLTATSGLSCDPVKWCAAMVIWSLQADGGFNLNNADCVNNSNGGVEFGNASFITASGHSPVPATPYKNPGAFTPNAATLLFNPGDILTVTMHDIPDSSPGPNGSGLEIGVNDQTSGQTGSTVASGTGPTNNGFAAPKWDPSASTCTMLPYNFHPMYNTSGLHTRVPWAAHTYNIDFTDEIGHFDYCSQASLPLWNPSGGCTGSEGPSTDSEAAETPAANSAADDSVCYDGSPSGTTLVPLSGCISTNLPGFDGVPYLSNAWPDGNFTLRPTPIRYTSPLTGPNYDQNYSDYALETNLPALEFRTIVPGTNNPYCDIVTGAGCTTQPPTDDSTMVVPTFGSYPWFSIDQHDPNQCWWLIGNDVAGQTSNDFGGDPLANSQYGTQYAVPYQQGISPTPYALLLTENFHTVGTTQTGRANPNACVAATVATPEAPMIPLFIAAGVVASVVGIGTRRRLRRLT